jgi:hypothetical protein
MFLLGATKNQSSFHSLALLSHRVSLLVPLLLAASGEKYVGIKMWDGFMGEYWKCTLLTFHCLELGHMAELTEREAEKCNRIVCFIEGMGLVNIWPANIQPQRD